MAEWIDLRPEIPDFLEDTRNQVSTFFEVLLTTLEIVLVTLSVVKVFLVGLINPLVVLLDVIINFIEGLLQDIRQIGFYLHGDYVYLKGDQGFFNFVEKMSGGYAAYEQRMVDRLLDRNDPGRPDISTSSAVFSLFFYSSVGGVDEILQLIEFIKALMALFNQETENILQVPAKPEAQLKYSTLGFFNVTNTFDDEAGVPDVVQVEWDMIQTGNPTGFSLTPAYPGRFLIEISTLPTGILIASSKEIDAGTGTPEGEVEFTSSFYQDPINKGPLRIFGGASRLQLPSGSSGWNDAIEGTSFKEGATPIFGIKSPKESEIIPLELLKHGDKNLLGVSYIVENLIPLFKPSFEITEDMLPFSAEFKKGSGGAYEVVEASVQRPRTFYVRVSTCSTDTSDVSDVELVLDRPNQTTPPSYTLKEGFQLSKVSQVQKISFPSISANIYIKSLQTALAILVLTRCDVEDDDFPNWSSKFSPLLASNNAKVKAIMEEFFSSLKKTAKKQEDCFSYRLNTLRRIQRASILMFERMGDLSEGIYELVLDTQDDLLNKEIYEDKTLLELLADVDVLDDATVTGLQKNRYSVGTLQESQFTVTPGLDVPNLLKETGAILAKFGSDGSPNINSEIGRARISLRPTEAKYLHDTLDADTISAAARVLQLTPSITRVEGDWLAFRLFPEGITPVEQFLDILIKSLKAIKEGLKGVVKAIEEFIKFFEIRIIQLQQILRQIEAVILKLLQVLQLIPKGAILITNSAGTTGVVSDLLTSENKPPINDSEYSTGVVALGGGVPTLIVDLIELLLTGED